MSFLLFGAGAVFGIIVYEAICKRRKGYFELVQRLSMAERRFIDGGLSRRREEGRETELIQQLQSELKLAAAELVILRGNQKEGL